MRDHTSLLAWQQAALTAECCVRLHKLYWRPELYAVFRQLSTSSLSARLNISEGYALGGPALQRRHYRIAYGSTVETIDLLRMLNRVGEGIQPEHLEITMKAALNTRGLVWGLMKKAESECPVAHRKE
jgi:four helix bundle protein